MATYFERHLLKSWLGVLLSLFFVGPATGSDGVVRINSTLFDKYIEALQPFTYRQTRWFNIQVQTLFGPVTVPVFCPVTATISGAQLTINTNNATVRGTVKGIMCSFPYSTSIASNVSISVDPSTNGLQIRPTGAMNINATVTVLLVQLVVPLSDIKLVPAMTVLSIPLDKISVQMTSPSGPRTLTLVARNHRMFLRNGFVEIQADLNVR